MAYLNRQERENLLKELQKLNFNKAKHKLIRMDPKGRLACFRNNQTTGKWITRFDLLGLGARVTLVESNRVETQHGKQKSIYELVEIIIEPTADNRT